METVRVGMVLGREISFPGALELLFESSRADLETRPDPVRLELERVPLGPFELGDPMGYRVVLDRVSHWHGFARQWLKQAALSGSYPINNPFQFQAWEKAAGAAAMLQLGLHVPRTWVLPEKDQRGHLPGVAERYHLPFSLEALGEELGYPLFLKPYDGGGWVGVSRPASPDELHREYDLSGRRIMLAQQAVPDAVFLRCLCVGPEVLPLAYAPGNPLHERYPDHPPDLDPGRLELARRLALTVSAFLGLDFNSVEILVHGDRFELIDFWNGVPDASLVSLGSHFLPLVEAMAGWILFAALGDHRFRLSPRAAAYLELAEECRGSPLPELLERYRPLVDAYFETARYRAFRAGPAAFLPSRVRRLLDLPGMARLVEAKIRATFPAHEVDGFLAWYSDRLALPVRGRGEAA